MPSSLDEVALQKLVHEFYASVRKDVLLAPIFGREISEADWPAHIAHIADFWKSIFLKNVSFTGNPMQTHLELAQRFDLTPAHFTQWLSLFRISADRVLSTVQADEVIGMAERIAKSLQMGLAFNLEKSGSHNHAFKDFGLRWPRVLH